MRRDVCSSIALYAAIVLLALVCVAFADKGFRCFQSPPATLAEGSWVVPGWYDCASTESWMAPDSGCGEYNRTIVCLDYFVYEEEEVSASARPLSECLDTFNDEKNGFSADLESFLNSSDIAYNQQYTSQCEVIPACFANAEDFAELDLDTLTSDDLVPCTNIEAMVVAITTGTVNSTEWTIPQGFDNEFISCPENGDKLVFSRSVKCVSRRTLEDGTWSPYTIDDCVDTIVSDKGLVTKLEFNCEQQLNCFNAQGIASPCNVAEHVFTVPHDENQCAVHNAANFTCQASISLADENSIPEQFQDLWSGSFIYTSMMSACTDLVSDIPEPDSVDGPDDTNVYEVIGVAAMKAAVQGASWDAAEGSIVIKTMGARDSLDACAWQVRCLSPDETDYEEANNFVPCTSEVLATYEEDLCPTTCNDAVQLNRDRSECIGIHTQILLDEQGNPRLDEQGNVMTQVVPYFPMDPEFNSPCAALEIQKPTVDCSCDIVCSIVTGVFGPCDEVGFKPAPACGTPNTRDVGYLTKGSQTPFYCAPTDPATTPNLCTASGAMNTTWYEVPTAEWILQTCNGFSVQCTSNEDEAGANWNACNNTYGFPTCTADNCGLSPKTNYTRKTKCNVENDQTPIEFVEDVLDYIDATSRAAYLAVLEQRCEELTPPYAMGSCDCETNFVCRNYSVDDEEDDSAVALDKWSECDTQDDMGYEFTTCPTTCENTVLEFTRNVACRLTNGTFVQVGEDNYKDSPCYIEQQQQGNQPSFSRECIGDVKCGATWLCSPDRTTLGFHNYTMSDNSCDDNAFFNDTNICYSFNIETEFYTENTCIVTQPQDRDVDEVYYRKRNVQCMLFDTENTQDIEKPYVPSNFQAPHDASYCEMLLNSTSIEEQPEMYIADDEDDIAACPRYVEGCEIALTSLATFPNVTLPIVVEENGVLPVHWTFIGPSMNTKVIRFEIAPAYFGPNSPALAWTLVGAAGVAYRQTSIAIPILPRPILVPKFYVRAFVANTPFEESNANTQFIYLNNAQDTIITVKLDQTCLTKSCTGANLAQPQCTIETFGEQQKPTCQCIPPVDNASTTVFTALNAETGQCERTNTCDAKSVGVCQNGGYLKYDSESTNVDQCASICTCPGGQTNADCSECPIQKQCNAKQGLPLSEDAQQCGCQKCYRGFYGADSMGCNLCIEYLNIAITYPSADFQGMLMGQPTDADLTKYSAKATFILAFIQHLGDITGYPANMINVNADLVQTELAPGVPGLAKVSLVFEFIGACRAAPQEFSLQQVSSIYDINWEQLSAVLTAPNGFLTVKGATTPGLSVITPTGGSAALAVLPPEVIDCKVDVTHPTCEIPTPEPPVVDPSNKDDTDNGPKIIMGVVIGVVGLIVIVIVALVLYFKCTGNNGSGESKPMMDSADKKNVPRRSSTRTIDNSNLELV